jgi:hypothetical protein
VNTSGLDVIATSAASASVHSGHFMQQPLPRVHRQRFPWADTER